MAEALGALVPKAKKRLELARAARYSREGPWAVALAFAGGRQNVKWDENSYSLVPAVSGAELKELYTFDLMRPLLLYLVARATMNHPDVQVNDPVAAKVVDTYDDRNKLQELVKRMATYNVAATTAFWAPHWDDNASAKVRVGEEVVSAPGIGNLAETFIPGHEMYFWPPTATNWDEVREFYHVCIEPTEELEAQYPELKNTKAEFRKSAEKLLRGFWTLVSVAFGSSSEKGQQASLPEGMELKVTVWEVPTETSKGRSYVMVGDELAQKPMENPYGVLPLVPLQYGDSSLSPWGEGPGYSMTPSQLAINRLISKDIRRTLAQKTTIFGRHGDGAGRDLGDSFKAGTTRITENLETRIVKVDMSAPIPTLSVDPSMGAELIAKVEKLEKVMQQQAGVHDPSIAVGQGESGVALRLRLDADQTQTAPYLRAIEQFLLRRAQVIAAMVKHHVPEGEMRWWGTDEDGVASDLSEWTAIPTFSIEAGSATLLSKSAMEDAARELLKEMPDDPLRQVVWSELLTTGPGALVRQALERAYEKQAATNPEEAEEPLAEEMAEEPGEEEYEPEDEDPGEFDDMAGYGPEGQGYLP
jgi:hypothetical protein